MATSNVNEAPVLVVAALSRELAKLNRKPCPGVVLLETGEGVANAKRELERWLRWHDARAVLSIGFGGALSPSLQIGDIVIARQVLGSPVEPDTRLVSAAASVHLDARPVLLGTALTNPSILWRAEAKKKVAGAFDSDWTGFVDMESTGIAEVCGKRGVPFLIARAISDLLDEDLPLDFNK